MDEKRWRQKGRRERVRNEIERSKMSEKVEKIEKDSMSEEEIMSVRERLG